MTSSYCKYSQHGIDWAEMLFRDFTEHPEWRGSKFSWKKFPDMAGGLARVNAALAFHSRPTVEQQDKCGQAAHNRAMELIANEIANE